MGTFVVRLVPCVKVVEVFKDHRDKLVETCYEWGQLASTKDSGFLI